ncbi:MAG: preprotein translocase subunit SecA [Clostridia bacterium]|nr:preprotein translocase subunit SecA [Clostridia bacterium]
MIGFIKKLLGGSNDAEIKRLDKIVAKIDALEPDMQKKSDAELRDQTRLFRERLAKGETLDDLLPEAFATVREAAVRTLDKRPYRVQLIGGIVLHQGRIAEMRTGEGKTLTAALPAYLNALEGEGVHIVTVNDYLAKFHSELNGKIFRFLGMTVGLVLHDMSAAERQQAYNSDITYGTNNEFGFDYLRDNMVIYKERMVQRPLHFAIVDEVDSILIDEARTPLIISGQGDKSTDLYRRADQFVKGNLHEGEDRDFVRDEKEKAITLTEQGVRRAEQYFGVENLTDPENTELHHHILAALRANVLMKRDVDYVVKEGQVVIVDEFTGRLMTGRRYSDGLHQAIEAKEGVNVQRESKTLATITFQNYFRMYKKLSGMTGTAKTEEEEFQGIYKLDVVVIPTNKPMIRKDMNTVVYMTQKGKYKAVADEVEKRHATGQPVLVGTVSVEKSEYMSRLLDQRGIPHTVLNAKFHEKEADIVAQAGKKGAVTIATNMAGRGTDILLGGNAEYMARHQLKLQGIPDEVIEEAIGFAEDVSDEVKDVRAQFKALNDKFSVETQREHDEVVKLGGLHIIGTERHEARRIDNQLAGRAGRQGDPGSSQFYVSFEDDLMRLFGSDRFKPMIEKLSGGEDDMPVDFSLVSKQIENAQKSVESRNFDIRKSVLQYDDVMNQQREIIYGQRRQVLEGSDMHGAIMEMRDTLVEEAVKRHISDDARVSDWDLSGLAEYLERVCLMKGGVQQAFDTCADKSQQGMIAAVKQVADVVYNEREKMWSEAGKDMREFERVALLTSVDSRWMDHIDAMSQLRDGIGLRAIAHRDPVIEYKMEGYEMFEEMIRLIQEDTLRKLTYTVVTQRVERREVAKPTQAIHASSASSEPAAKKPARAVAKVGRNDPCPCGSGKKYKNCCGRVTNSSPEN